MALGLLIAVIVIGLLLSRLDLSQVKTSLMQASFLLLLAMELIKIAETQVKAMRWGYAVHSVVGGPRPKGLFSATMISFLGNMIFPARLGELLRVQIFQKNNQHVTRSLALTCSVLPQIFDLIVVLLMLLLGISLRGEKALPYSKIFLPLGVVFFLLVMLYFSHRFFPQVMKLLAPILRRFPEGLQGKLRDMAEEINKALGLLANVKRIVVLFGFTLVIWVMETAAISLGMYAFGIPITPTLAITATAAISLAFLLPVTPGALGAHQIAAMWSLGLFGIAAEKATATSLGMQAVDILMVMSVGLLCFYREGLSFREVTSQSPESTKNSEAEKIEAQKKESADKNAETE